MKSASLVITFTLVGTEVLGQSLGFVDVTLEAGLAYPVSNSWRQGVAVGDYNGDGWLDICFTGNSEVPTMIYRNDGSGAFTDMTSTILPPNMPSASMATFADIDNDDDLDLLLARWVTSREHTCFDFLLNVNGVFEIGDNACEAAEYSAFAGGMTVGDPDRDGDLDVAFTHWFGPAWYLVNSGSGAFVLDDNTLVPGLNTFRQHWQPVFADFDNDGWHDLHVAVDVDAEYHARNMGNGTFEDMAGQLDFSGGSSDMGIACGDIENDGDIDFFVTNIAHHVLHVNDGNGTFTQEADTRGVNFNGSNGTAWGTAFIDFDHDMDQDLVYVTTGSPWGSLFENDGNGFFTDVTATSGMALQGSGLVPFDFDRDGDMDLVIADSSRPFLYENVAPARTAGHWLHVTLRGHTSNSAGIGARIEVTVGGQTMMREVLGGYSFFAGTPAEAHFGLGTATMVDSLHIEWPSGIIQDLAMVAADQHLVVIETGGEPVPAASQWGLIIMAMLLLTAGSVLCKHRKPDASQRVRALA